MEYIAIVLLIVYSGYREYLWHKERKDIYDRLMSKSAEEYKYVSDKNEPEKEEKEDDSIQDIPTNPNDIPMDLKEEIMYGGEES